MVTSKFLNSENKHLFSFFFQEMPTQGVVPGTTITIKDLDLAHRLVHVVRLGLQEQRRLFHLSGERPAAERPVWSLGLGPGPAADFRLTLTLLRGLTVELRLPHLRFLVY